MSLDEELGKIVGTTDQSSAAFVSVALSLSAFFKTLLSEGMKREEALMVVMAATSSMFTGKGTQP